MSHAVYPLCCIVQCWMSIAHLGCSLYIYLIRGDKYETKVRSSAKRRGERTNDCICNAQRRLLSVSLTTFELLRQCVQICHHHRGDCDCFAWFVAAAARFSMLHCSTTSLRSTLFECNANVCTSNKLVYIFHLSCNSAQLDDGENACNGAPNSTVRMATRTSWATQRTTMQ